MCGRFFIFDLCREEGLELDGESEESELDISPLTLSHSRFVLVAYEGEMIGFWPTTQSFLIEHVLGKLKVMSMTIYTQGRA